MSQETTVEERLPQPDAFISYTVIRPGGNDTALVNGIIDDPKQRKRINDALMQRYPNVEQVGFIDLTPESEQLMMAGGEFCGNATRSTAFLALNGTPGEILLQVSGVDQPLRAGVTQNGEAYAQMPVYANPDKIRSVDSDTVVEMEGITQCITYEIQEIIGKNPDQIKAVAMAKIRALGLDTSPAAGVIYTEKVENQYRIIPVVYVRDIDTLFLETACGSGTTALGLTLSKEQGKGTRASVMQPSGLPITVDVTYDGKTFGYTQISGPVDTLEVGSLETRGNGTVVVEKITSRQKLREALVNGNLAILYQDIFSQAPYFESFTVDDVAAFFDEYIENGLLFLAQDGKETIGFGAAIPLVNDGSVAETFVNNGLNIDGVWYMADLGVKDIYRKRGIGRQLVQSRLDALNGNMVVMRTSENNLISQSLYRSLGFKELPGVSQYVEGSRIDGQTTTDRRIFLYR